MEVDLLGNVKGEWCASRRPQGACTGVPVDALTMHHSFAELPNGNPLLVSGAMEYSFDPQARPAKLVWASDTKGQPETVNTFAMGDVTPLPDTGNVMVVYGSAVRSDISLPWSRVREYRHTTPPQVVYDVVLADPSGKQPVAWIAFGGERVARLQ